jgi:FkbM family methyltransferase
MNFIEAFKERVKRRLGVPSVEHALTALAGRGFQPEVVFDVGAYKGVFALFCRKLFKPAPQVFCFEALRTVLPRLRELETQREIVLVQGLVGASDRDDVEFHEMETASSVLSEQASGQANATMSRCRMRRLDSLIESREVAQTPDLLKIDTQGFEMEVLKGIERHLPQVRVILAEINLLDIHSNVTLAHDVIGWLGARGWVPYDICSLIRRPLDQALWQSDMLFVKTDDPLRSDKRWG